MADPTRTDLQRRFRRDVLPELKLPKKWRDTAATWAMYYDQRKDVCLFEAEFLIGKASNLPTPAQQWLIDKRAYRSPFPSKVEKPR